MTRRQRWPIGITLVLAVPAVLVLADMPAESAWSWTIGIVAGGSLLAIEVGIAKRGFATAEAGAVDIEHQPGGTMTHR